MRIAEAARAAGTTPRALRWYQQHGLLEPGRSPAGYRDYDERAVERVRRIRELLDLGFTLIDVRAFVDLLDREVPAVFSRPGSPICRLALERARARLAVLDERIAAATRIRDRLAERLAEEG
ncbi:MerR family transcriptional regulator [Nonomuraea zeae]|uniref:MerR family transcriptional regulator n=1 Tax=Nonomuraea zeae TaxID=1642303 RepID=A0A5S4EWR8_9ACTN|nr:MerR family transcriptional regulator [Nonomuraea zeae]TMR07908.1 MerR family transcriptional regulator [Nonomuraea zeae]